MCKLQPIYDENDLQSILDRVRERELYFGFIFYKYLLAKPVDQYCSEPIIPVIKSVVVLNSKMGISLSR